ncbi:FAD/NAD(P)-dependent oxidoreductase [Thioalkalivibrio sp. HK1]|uniref:FAD/NAD(P)-dependent oxidoreductase n=1 Tax=Thioalkalivibrio sp. HK1 TaxID=1469245 RepID=UPI000471D31C|nr:NAD(P)/FAD-dependent oxidoreductase [Thioalkalivibrio sp. HK1]
MSEDPLASSPVELAVIGAGPAGMAAAIEARAHGIETLVLDEQGAPGGQVYRNIERICAHESGADAGPADLLGKDYRRGMALVDAFRGCGARYLPGASIWDLALKCPFDGQGADARGGRSPALREDLVEIGIVHRRRARLLQAKTVIVATGSLERPVPVPGATLPGVMGLGAVQSMLKASGMVPDVPVVIAGSGPLVYLATKQLLMAGVSVRALLLTTPSDRLRRVFSSLPDAFSRPKDLYKGLRWRQEIVRKGVPVLRGVSDLAIEGEGRVEAVRFEHRSCHRRLPAYLALLHEGVIANAHLTLAASLAHRWDRRQHALRPLTDDWNQTQRDGRERAVWVAGDCAGIAGASAAVHSARIAALSAAHHLGRIDRRRRNALARPAFKALAFERRFRRFLERIFEPADEVLRPRDLRTMVCRCEEVSVADIERAIEQGCSGPNQLKAFLRCGMGPCQGRMCAGIVSAIFEDHARRTSQGKDRSDPSPPDEDPGHFRIRPPIRPLRLGQLANLETGDVERKGSLDEPKIEAIRGEDSLNEDNSGGEPR